MQPAARPVEGLQPRFSQFVLCCPPRFLRLPAQQLQSNPTHAFAGHSGARSTDMTTLTSNKDGFHLAIVVVVTPLRGLEAEALLGPYASPYPVRHSPPLVVCRSDLYGQRRCGSRNVHMLLSVEVIINRTGSRHRHYLGRAEKKVCACRLVFRLAASLRIPRQLLAPPAHPPTMTPFRDAVLCRRRCAVRHSCFPRARPAGVCARDDHAASCNQADGGG
ncbi:hypothetical protein C8Q79DRAFT_501855 [Trametes meyenii]|nr:hypothetical protein C8Q79DRAFT_501855 [Trametes meyenii]